MNESQREVWLLKVSGYGQWLHVGTKENADEACAAKAEWEGGKGTIKYIGLLYAVLHDLLGDTEAKKVIRKLDAAS